ncbi:MAG TPA: response regulator transcription factor [Bacteroidales bacterium]|jgi:Response regulators consisting of a CheY-like receiver domain and a winged-helix DNA-binding domain
MKVLIIEDEKALADSIEMYLSQGGYLCERVENYNRAREKINLYNYDCIVVDIGLPDGNGLQIIRELKANKSGTGIIIISARDSLNDKIEGLDIGADDYLTKPFHLSELNARLKSVIRRRSFEGNNEIICNEIRISPDNLNVTIDNKPVVLTRKEYDLLLYFISNKNRLVTKESIAEHLWGDNMDLADSYDFIYTHIKNLRRKLLNEGAGDYIQTIYGIGYKFNINI